MLGIVVLDYKSNNLTIDYIKNELCKVQIPKKIVVVNAVCTDESNATLCRELGAELITDIDAPVNKNHEFFVVASTENTGYARGNNLGADFLTKHFDEINYLLFSNNDINFIDSDVVDVMIEVFDQNDDIGAVCPQILGPTGIQGPFKYLSIWKQIIYFAFYPFSMFFKSLKNNLSNPETGYCYWGSGSFLMVSKAKFLEVGKFDSRTFLGNEERILAERFKKCGYRFYRFGNKKIYHFSSNGKTRTLKQLRKSVKISFFSATIYFKYYIEVSSFQLFLFRTSFCWYRNIGLPLKVSLVNNLKTIKQKISR